MRCIRPFAEGESPIRAAPPSVSLRRSCRRTSLLSQGSHHHVRASPDGKQVYVSLRDENSVAVIDTATREVVGKIGVGRNPIQLYAAGRDLMYVANQGSESDPDNTVSVIDTRRKTLIKTMTTGKGAHGVVASDDGRFVFVTNSVDNTVSAIDNGSQEVVATYPVGLNPNGISYRRVR